jgi:arsenate reductase-like glutaredoxin family protein
MIQIIGRSTCQASRKAKRFFSERGIDFQDFDLKSYKITAGVLKNITRSVPAAELIDEEGRYYKKQGFQWREFDPLEEILEHPELLKTPIVRSGKDAVCGENPEVWEGMILRMKD